MPKIVDSWVKKVMKSWKTKAQAYAIIVTTLKKAGEMDSKWNLTALGKKRNAMSEKSRNKTSVAKTKASMKKPAKKKK